MATPTTTSTTPEFTSDGKTSTQTRGPFIDTDEKPSRDQLYSPSEDAEKSSTSHDVRPIDHAAEARLIRKLDFYIVPPVMLLYLFSFLDRVNIGNARLYGMEEDLGLKGSDYQTAVSLLFVTYILCELPSNLVLKKFTPSRWLAFIATSWGIIATLTGVTKNYAGLIVCRLLLGAVEGGLFPGLTIYLTLFYTKRELALRVGYLFVSAAISGGVGGLLAYGIGFMDGVSGLRGWRWIMIIEGLPTVLLGILTWWWLADEPETAYYLSTEERELVRIRKARQIGYSQSGDDFHKEDMIKALKDWKIWAFCFGQFGADTMLYGYSTFLPTIIKGLGDWSSAQTNALTIPCYALGAITYLIVAKLSDSYQQRGLPVAVFSAVSVIGYGILMADVSSGAHYFACFLIASGLYVAVGIPLAWNPANQPRYGKRTTASGMQLTIGNTSGIMAPFLYLTPEAPRYIRGQAVTLSLVAFSGLLYSCMSLYFMRRNQARKEGKEDWKIEGKSEEQIAEMGDESPRYMFTK